MLWELESRIMATLLNHTFYLSYYKKHMVIIHYERLRHNPEAFTTLDFQKLFSIIFWRGNGHHFLCIEFAAVEMVTIIIEDRNLFIETVYTR